MTAHGFFSAAAAVFKLLFFVLWTLLCLLPYMLTRLANGPAARVSHVYWKGVIAVVLRAKLRVRGEMSAARPLMLVSNHASYLDIVFLGATVDGVFVSKAEVRDWPGFGLMARAARTIFIDRRRMRAARVRDQLAARLRDGAPLILFPEGTSSDGDRVLRFKSGLFNVAEDGVVAAQPVHVQPVSLAYTRYAGLPMGWTMRPFFSWFGDMELVDHLWEAVRLGRFEVEITFHPPVTREQFADRKALSKHCEHTVRQGVNESLLGRPPATPVKPGGA